MPGAASEEDANDTTPDGVFQSTLLIDATNSTSARALLKFPDQVSTRLPLLAVKDGVTFSVALKLWETLQLIVRTHLGSVMV
jgi:hypothetical protein